MSQIRMIIGFLGLIVLSACGRDSHFMKPPEFDNKQDSAELFAMQNPGLPETTGPDSAGTGSSLWRAGRASLLGDRRAVRRGDILTVVIEIDDEAEISNSTSRSRSGSENLGIPSLFGIPQRVDANLPEGASLSSAVSIDSSSASNGQGSVSRNEKLTLRVAATIVDVLPNGVFAIEGEQQVRVNFEMRELQISGYVRPEDISRQNEITSDKIASAQISYGGRGHISAVQQPRYGQQALDRILPF